MRGRSVFVQPGITPEVWRDAIAGITFQSLRRCGILCMSVSITPQGNIALRDPHQHLEDPEARQLLQDEIKDCCDPYLARVVCEVLFGQEA